MSRVKVYQEQDAGTVVARVEATIEAVRRRAFELFEAGGCVQGKDMDDWLQAEKDLFFVPHSEVSESEKEFRVTLSAPGFEAGDIEVMALPRELLVEAKTERRMESRRDGMRADSLESRILHRRFDLTAPIQTGKVTARIDEGTLTIDAPKQVPQRLLVRAAAA